MRMVSEAESWGEPLSVTRMVMLFVAGAAPNGGVQENAPVVGLIVAPPGAPESRLNVSAFAGMSGSGANAGKVSGEPSFTGLLPMFATVGATFTSETTITNL